MISKNILSLLWLAAFLCSLFFIDAWQLELFGAAVVILFGWAIVTLSQGGASWRIPQSWPLRIMELFWLLVFLSIFRSDILNVSLMSFCFVSAMPLSFLVFAVRGNEKQFQFIAKILAVIFAGLSIWALLQFFAFSDYFGSRAVHPLNNPNSLGALLTLGFFCSVGWMLAAKTKAQSNLALLLSVLIFGGIVATASRGALFSILPTMGLFLFVMREHLKPHRRCLGILFVLCVSLFGLSALGAVSNDNLIARVSDTLAMNLGDITSNRFSLWAAAIEMIKVHGLLGTGTGTYFLYFPEFRLSEDFDGAYYAHSDPLQYWVELGVLGPILFYAFIIAVIGRTIRAFNKTKDVTQRFLIMTPFCALGAVILHTHVTFNLYNLSILFCVGFLLGVWFWATQDILKTPTKEISFPESYSPAARTLAIAIPFVFIGMLFMAYISSEHFTNKARDHLLAGELEGFADDVLLANRLSFDGNYRAYLLAVNVPLSLLEEAGDKLNMEQKRDIFNQGLSYLRHVRSINPRSSSALYYLAKIQQISLPELIPEDLKSPADYYTQALAIDPLHLGARLELSDIYKRGGKPQKALDILEQGFDFKYGSSKAMEFYGRLTQIYLQKGDKIGRDKAIRKMRAFQSRLQQSEKRKNNPLHTHLFEP